MINSIRTSRSTMNPCLHELVPITPLGKHGWHPLAGSFKPFKNALVPHNISCTYNSACTILCIYRYIYIYIYKICMILCIKKCIIMYTAYYMYNLICDVKKADNMSIVYSCTYYIQFINLHATVYDNRYHIWSCIYYRVQYTIEYDIVSTWYCLYVYQIHMYI